MFINEKNSKKLIFYDCIICDFNTSNKNDYNRHRQTKKHIINNNQCFSMEKTQKNSFACSCGKTYKDNSGLWRHKKICNNEIFTNTEKNNEIFTNTEKNNEIFTNTEKDVDNLVQYLIKENADFKQLILDQNKQMLEMANKVGNNTNINSNNTNNFNLNFFLNETCKNALNIMDFVGQLNLGIKDLEETGRLGFADGISKIFINGLKQLDISNRPLHCCDVKRETLYIKNDNQWNKEDNQKSILTNAIKHVAHKNIKKISEWTKEHPEFNDSSSKENDKYLKIVSEAMSGSTQEETDKNYNKIIKNIIKETIIDK